METLNLLHHGNLQTQSKQACLHKIHQLSSIVSFLSQPWIEECPNILIAQAETWALLASTLFPFHHLLSTINSIFWGISKIFTTIALLPCFCPSSLG